MLSTESWGVVLTYSLDAKWIWVVFSLVISEWQKQKYSI